MKITISEPQKVAHFTAIFHNLKQFSDNMVIYFNSDNFYIQGLDGCHCCLFECKLTSQWFDNYDYDAEKDQPYIGVNLALLHKIIGTRHTDQTIELMVEKDSDNLDINFVGSAENNLDRFFEISLIDIQCDLMELPPPDTLVDLTMNTSKFQELISQMLMFNNEVLFSFGEDKIKLNASGNDGSMRTEIKFDDVQEYAIAEGTELTQTYSLKYINMMCNFHKLNSEICMGFSESMPMYVKYNLDDDSYVSFYLAPKIEN